MNEIEFLSFKNLIFYYSLNERMDRTIIEGLHDIVSVLEDNLKTLVKAELSVLVDILYRPELLFPTGTEARRKCENGGFIKRLINHTSKLFEEKQDFLCVKILGTLRYFFNPRILFLKFFGTIRDYCKIRILSSLNNN